MDELIEDHDNIQELPGEFKQEIPLKDTTEKVDAPDGSIKLEENKLMISLEFDEVEINLLFKALGELPAKETYPLISKIAYLVNEFKKQPLDKNK